eukprot:6184057-Ditylum_brightwellii.AAC.1
MDCCFQLSRSLPKALVCEYPHCADNSSKPCRGGFFVRVISWVFLGAMLGVLLLFDDPLFCPLSIAELLPFYVFVLFNKDLVLSE